MMNTANANHNLSGAQFSTLDQDNDFSILSCADIGRGGWWYNDCYNAFLNGPWTPGYWLNPWRPAVSFGDDVKETKMMVKLN
jgi:hypothetical protein